VTAASCFAYEPSGRVIVVFDGKEVLVHGGGDESPQWRKELEADILGLAAKGDVVVTLEAGGRISWWGAASGEPLGSVTSGEQAFALAAARNAAVFLAVLPGGVEIVEQGKLVRSIPFRGPVTAAAFRDDGDRIAVGSEDGEVAIVTRDGTPVGTSKLDGPVSSLCFCPAGFWIATWGERMVRVEAEGGPPKPITRAGGMAPDWVCTSSDGSLFAMRVKPRMVMAYGYPPGEQVVQLDYFDRQVAGLAFGPGRRLGVGLVGGDGNIADIPAGQLLRTDTFPGRKHNSWMLGMNIDPSAAPKAAPVPAPETRPEPPARPQGRAPRPDSEPPAVVPASSQFPWVWVGAAIAVLLAIVVAMTR
jgi:hypothetical protein